MNNKVKIFIGAAVALLVLFFVRLRSKLKKVEFGINPKKVKVLQYSLQGVTVLLPVWIYNPTGSDVIMKNLDLGIYVDKLFLASISTEQKYMLKAGVASEYPVEVNIPYKNLLNVLKQRGTVIDDPNWPEKVNLSVAGRAGMEIGLLSLNNIKIQSTDTVQNWTT